MERKLPKNIRQIGNVSDNPKVYVEDYVDTFISQMSDKAIDKPVGAFLIGETFRKEEQDYIFIHGAVQMEDIRMNGSEIVLGDRTWKKACERGKRYFAGNTILGWVLIAPNQQMKLNTNLMKIHERLFMKKSRMLILKDSVDKEETFFVYKYNDLMEIAGHYIYYEKNPEMQEYMIANRKQNCVTPSESYEDRVTKDFRSAINKQNEERSKKQMGQKSYAVSVALVLIVFVMGVSSINNYDNLRAVQNLWSNFVTQNQEEEEVVAEDVIMDTYIVTGSDVGNEVENDGYASDEQLVTPEEGVDNQVVKPEVEPELDLEEDMDVALPQGDGGSVIDYETYVVETADTVADICRRFYDDVTMIDEVCVLNNLEDSDYIYVGQVLQLPYK